MSLVTRFFDDRVLAAVTANNQPVVVTVVVEPANGSPSPRVEIQAEVVAVPNTIGALYAAFPDLRRTVGVAFPSDWYVTTKLAVAEVGSPVRVTAQLTQCVTALLTDCV
jgi:hypothetical protein